MSVKQHNTPTYKDWIYTLFIVPEAHTRIFDDDFQGRLYETFHTTRTSRLGHALCTPLINLALFSLGGLFSLPLTAFGLDISISGILVLVLLAQCFYLYVYGAWALSMAPLLLLSGIIASLASITFDSEIIIIAPVVMLVCAYLQTFSHWTEPLPPPWSRSYRFMPVSQFLQQESTGNILKLVLLSLTVYPLLELWAAFRIWPLQIAQLLNRLGYFKGRMQVLHKQARNLYQRFIQSQLLPSGLDVLFIDHRNSGRNLVYRFCDTR